MGFSCVWTDRALVKRSLDTRVKLLPVSHNLFCKKNVSSIMQMQPIFITINMYCLKC